MRPVWATCFSHDERLYDVKRFDKEGTYHPIADYDQGNYLEGNYAPVPGEELTYDYGGDEPGYVVFPTIDIFAARLGKNYVFSCSLSLPRFPHKRYRELPPQEGYDVHAAPGEATYDLAAQVGVEAYDVVEKPGVRASAASSYDVSAMRTALSAYDVVAGPGNGRGAQVQAQAQESYDVVVNKQQPGRGAAVREDSYDVVVDKSKKK